jgi:hypothetical protein
VAQINPQGIMLYGTLNVGSVSVNGGMIRGEGGPVRPRIVVPLKIDMNPQPTDAMIAVVSLTASLGAQPNASPTRVLCQPLTRHLVSGFPAHSGPTANSHTEDLRFFLTQAEIEDIEALRHTANTDVLTLHVDLEVVVAALKSHNKAGTEQTQWDSRFGMFSEVLPFWTTQVQPLQINIEESTWVREVLPALGYDRLRLIELTFPPPLPDHTNAASQFDMARRALDKRRYGDCIDKCRGILNMWETQFNAGKNRHVAQVIAENRDWPEGDVRRQLLDTLWKEVGDIANAPHHPEGDVDAELFERRDARLILLLIAALSEYVSSNKE